MLTTQVRSRGRCGSWKHQPATSPMPPTLVSPPLCSQERSAARRTAGRHADSSNIRQPLVQSSPSTHLRCVGLVQLTVIAIVAGSSEGLLYRVGGRGVSAGRRRRGGQSLRSRLPRWPHRAPTPPRPPSERGRAALRRLLVPKAGRNDGAENAEILSR